MFKAILSYIAWVTGFSVSNQNETQEKVNVRSAVR